MFQMGLNHQPEYSTTPAAPGDDSYATAALVSGQHLVKSHSSNDSSDSDFNVCFLLLFLDVDDVCDLIHRCFFV